MIIPIDQSAPKWAQQMARDYSAAIAAANLGPFVSLSPFTVALKPDATKNAWKLIFLSDGVANKFVAVSNGVAWFYLQGTAV